MQKSAGELPRVGGYELVETLQLGSAVAVHRAVHPGREVEVILKVSRRKGALDRECAMVRKLSTPGHQNVVELVDFGQEGELSWLATRRVLGPSLSDLLRPPWGSDARSSGIRRRGGTDALKHNLQVVYELATALAYIHQRGIVHADLSPANILLEDGGHPVLVDFGSAREQPPWGAERVDASSDEGGTPGYVAPERLRREYWDTRADIYALGCIWYELVTGRPVFWATDQQTLAFQHLETPPPSAAQWLPLSEGLTAAIAATLRKQPYDRTPSAEVIVGVLERELGLSRSPRPEPSPSLFRSRAFGRERERAQLRAQLRAAGSGRSSLTLVVGSSGAGKSRLLVDAQEEAKRLGFRVQVGGQLGLPAAVAPGVVTDPRPLALLIDDAESLPKAAWPPLLQAARDPSGTVPVSLILTWSQEFPVPPELGVEGVHRVHVGPLSRAATAAALADTFAQPRLDAELLGAVFRASLGNPRALHEYVADLVRYGFLEHKEGSWIWPTPPSDQQAPSWADPIRARARALSEGAREAACVAAVLGDSFTVAEFRALLAEAGRGDTEAADAQLAELLESRLLSSAGAAQLRFVSPSYRAVFESLLEPERRAQLHLSRAAALSADPRSSEDSLRLGLHHAAMGSTARAIRHLRAAAQADARAGFTQRSIHVMEVGWTEALRLLDAEPHRKAVHLRIGYALLVLLNRAADHHGLREVAKQLLALSGDGERLLRAKVHRLWAVSLRITGQYAEAQHHLTLAQAILGHPLGRGHLADQRERIRNRMAAAWAHYAARDGLATEQIVEEVLPLARRVGTPGQLADAYMWRANAIALHRSYAFSRKAVAYERKAVSIQLKRGTALRELVLFRFDLAFMLLLGGRAECEEAVEQLELALASSSELQDVTLVSRVTTYLAIAYRRTGQAERCADIVERALEQALQCDQQGYVGAARACRAWLHLRRGEQRAATAEATGALAVWSRLRAHDETRRSEYPFQWLALIPQLALAAAEEHPDRCPALIADLLHPTQARLARPVRRELAAASGQIQDWPLAAQFAWLERFLPLAARHGYL